MLVKLAEMFNNLTDCIKKMAEKHNVNHFVYIKLIEIWYINNCFEGKLSMFKTSDTDTVKV